MTAPPAKKPGTFAAGADARRGVGKKGRSGRKPNAFYTKCEDATEQTALPKILAYLAAGTPSDLAWQWCATYVSKFSRAEAPKRVDVGSDPSRPLELRIVYADE